MRGVATEKVPGGKLVRVKVDFDKTINSLQITGDFFLHPEDALEEMEKNVIGADVNVDDRFLKNKLDEVIQKHKVMLVGVSSDDIARLIKGAMK